MLSYLQTLDWSVLHAIRTSLQCGFLDAWMPRVTLLGDNGVIWIAAALLLLANKKKRKYGLLLLLALLAGVLVGNVCLKHLVARPRPCWLEAVPLLIANPTDFSFPSGHTLSSAIAATVLTAMDRRLSFLVIPLAVLIAFSRLYLFVHFPSDVLCGAVLGVAIGLCAVAIFRRSQQKQHLR